MNTPAHLQKDIYGVTDDVLVQKDLMQYELSSRTRAMGRMIAEKDLLLKQISQLEGQLEKMQELLDQHALKLEK